MSINLNVIEPVNDGFHRLDPNNVESEVASVSAFFRDIKSELIAAINKADAVFGCVAWLTDKSILDALESRENSSIVVKDDDINSNLKTRPFKGNWIKLEHLATESNYFHALNRAYGIEKGLGCLPIEPPNRLHLPEQPIDKYRMINAVSAQNFAADINEQDVTKSPPMLHNKFLIFAKVSFTKTELTDVSNYYYAGGVKSRDSEDMFLRTHGTPIVTPYAVWTGSFNFSVAASTHLENAVLIHNRNIAEAYFKEFSLIYYLSQPLIPHGVAVPFQI